jgi:hypothetical protein
METAGSFIKKNETAVIRHPDDAIAAGAFRWSAKRPSGASMAKASTLYKTIKDAKEFILSPANARPPKIRAPHDASTRACEIPYTVILAVIENLLGILKPLPL